MAIVSKDKDGKRSARLQAVFQEERKFKPILDMLEYYDKNKHSQKDVLYKALHLLAHRWSKDNDIDISVKPEKHIEQILTYLKDLHQGQNEMMETIMQLRNGTITMAEFDSRVDDIQERQSKMNVLEGASNYSGGLFMLDDEDD